jgi:hypothetical protein
MYCEGSLMCILHNAFESYVLGGNYMPLKLSNFKVNFLNLRLYGLTLCLSAVHTKIWSSVEHYIIKCTFVEYASKYST